MGLAPCEHKALMQRRGGVEPTPCGRMAPFHGLFDGAANLLMVILSKPEDSGLFVIPDNESHLLMKYGYFDTSEKYLH